MPPAPAGPAGPAKPSPFAGRTIARCVVGERLGRGATSHVFRARYEPLGRDIAVKILSKDQGSEEVRRRFLSEARAVAKLDHENIVKVLDVVEDQNLLCILMELVQGPTLQDRLDDEEVIPPLQTLRIATQIARALEAAHEQKIVHRDVKPANVMLFGRPGEQTVKVVDFGLAAQQEVNRVGTPYFMSPEAAQGKRIDEKSDVYALGVCLYRMLTGALPFTGSTVKEILAAHVNAELTPPSEKRPQLGRAYDDLLKRLLVKSKGYRPGAGDTADLLEDMADDLEEKEKGVRIERRRRKRKLTRKKSGSGAMIGVGIAVVAVIAIGIAASGGGKPPVPVNVSPQPAAMTPEEAGQKAFDEVDRWDATRASNVATLTEAVQRWSAVERAHPGTRAAEAAKVRRQTAETALKAQQGAAAKTPKTPDPPPNRRDDPPPVRQVTDPKVLLSRLEDAVRRLDWNSAASQIMDIEDPPEGTSGTAWDQRSRRLDLLKRSFVTRLDTGFHALKDKIKAKELFPEAKDGETVIGARSDGAVLTDGKDQRTIAWAKLRLDGFFQKRGLVIDRVLSTAEVEDNLVLACVAAETGRPAKEVRNFADNVRQLLNDPDAADEKLKPFGW